MSGTRVGIIGVPLGYGAEKTGSELGINAMRSSYVRGKRLAEHIQDLGFDVTDHGDASIVAPADPVAEGENPKHLAEMTASCENIISAVGEILRNAQLPIILGGDHSIAIGTFSALSLHYREKGDEIGLIWFDAHADINTPETSTSGNIHGMPL